MHPGFSGVLPQLAPQSAGLGRTCPVRWTGATLRREPRLQARLSVGPNGILELWLWGANSGRACALDFPGCCSKRKPILSPSEEGAGLRPAIVLSHDAPRESGPHNMRSVMNRWEEVKLSFGVTETHFAPVHLCSRKGIKGRTRCSTPLPLTACAIARLGAALRPRAFIYPPPRCA